MSDKLLNKIVQVLNDELKPGLDKGSTRAIIDTKDFKKAAVEIIKQVNSSNPFVPVPKKIECISGSDDDDWGPGHHFTLKENGNCYWNEEYGGFSVDYFKEMAHRFKSLDELKDVAASEEKAFYAGRERIKHPDYDFVYETYGDYTGKCPVVPEPSGMFHGILIGIEDYAGVPLHEGDIMRWPNQSEEGVIRYEKTGSQFRIKHDPETLIPSVHIGLNVGGKGQAVKVGSVYDEGYTGKFKDIL